MLGIKIDVTPPTVRDDAAQTPIALTELKGWQIYTQIDGALSWSPIGGLNTVDVATRTIGNVPEGTKLRVRTTWFDTQDPSKEGLAAEDVITAVIIVPPPVLAAPAAGGMVLSVVPQ